jgi:hypothetical protein
MENWKVTGEGTCEERASNKIGLETLLTVKSEEVEVTSEISNGIGTGWTEEGESTGI